MHVQPSKWSCAVWMPKVTLGPVGNDRCCISPEHVNKEHTESNCELFCQIPGLIL